MQRRKGDPGGYSKPEEYWAVPQGAQEGSHLQLREEGLRQLVREGQARRGMGDVGDDLKSCLRQISFYQKYPIGHVFKIFHLSASYFKILRSYHLK